MTGIDPKVIFIAMGIIVIVFIILKIVDRKFNWPNK
jgi:hypothetical protein